MKDKFIRILSPIAVAVMIVLDISVIYFAYFSIKKLMELKSFYTIIFTVLVAFAIIVAIFVSKEILTQGIKFKSDEVEFTGLDDNNIFKYDDIANMSFEKDEKASFVKNFVDRQSKIILELKDEKVVTIDIGLTTKKLLIKIEKEFASRIS